jgi:small redox-active disulfide protein 2
MGLFSKKIKATNTQSNNADVKILGSGCAKCNQLESNTIEALRRLNLDTTIEHVKDFSKIASYGVMTTPAIVYKGKVITYGKVLKPDEIVDLLKKEGF